MWLNPFITIISLIVKNNFFGPQFISYTRWIKDINMTNIIIKVLKGNKDEHFGVNISKGKIFLKVETKKEKFKFWNFFICIININIKSK